MSNGPGYWRNEQGGVLGPAVEAYMNGEGLSAAQIAVIRAYLRQWIMSPVWDQNPHAGEADRAELAKLRAGIDGLTNINALETWLYAAEDTGLDPL